MKSLTVKVSLVVLVICLTTSIATATIFGASCESDAECNSLAFLTCQNGTCDCQYPEDQMLDPVRNSCIFKLGKVCRGYSAPIPIEIAQRYEMADFCVPNAKCSISTKKCACDDGYFESVNGTCEPNRLYQQSCNSDTECESKYGFTCSADGKCDCNTTSGFYDVTMKKCVTKFGFPCNSSMTCATNSRCDYLTISAFGRSTYRQTCICHSNAFPTTEGTCELKRDHGAACNSSRECNSDLKLVCESGTCQCKDEFVYESPKNKCLSLVGTSCDRFTSSPCVSNATCQEIKDQRASSSRSGPREYICQCSENHYMVDNRTCQRKQGYDEPCSSDLPCQSKKPLSLFCDSGHCKCSGNDTVYDEKSKECRKSLGSKCTFGSDCVSTAVCNNQKCACGSWGYDATPDATGRYCIAGYNSKCNATLPCDADKGHVCRDGRCQCTLKDHHYYDSRAKKCLTYVNGPCDANGATTCVGNAECTSSGMLGEQECRCKPGFVSVDRLCEVGYGQPCNYTGHSGYDSGLRCDRLAPLYCTNGICQCAEFQYFDESTMKCMGLVGAKCKVPQEKFIKLVPGSMYIQYDAIVHSTEGKDEFCVDGATCKVFRAMDGVKKNEGICRCKEGFVKYENGRCFSKDDASKKPM